MIAEIIQALLSAGLIVGLATFAMVFWSLLRGYSSFERTKKTKQKPKQKPSEQSLKEKGDKRWWKRQANHSETKKKESEKPPSDFIHSKWAKFGGGYYGIVALLTLGWVEFLEIRDFLTNFTSLRHFIDTISIGMLIDLIIDSFMNFVVAISWPAYWISNISNQYIWIWFFATYLGYIIGDRLARQRFSALKSL